MRQREEAIVWQNQSHLVQRYAEQRGLNLTLFDICRVTDVMTEYVITGRDKSVTQKLEAIESYFQGLESKQQLNG